MGCGPNAGTPPESHCAHPCVPGGAWVGHGGPDSGTEPRLVDFRRLPPKRRTGLVPRSVLAGMCASREVVPRLFPPIGRVIPPDAAPGERQGSGPRRSVDFRAFWPVYMRLPPLPPPLSPPLPSLRNARRASLLATRTVQRHHSPLAHSNGRGSHSLASTVAAHGRRAQRECPHDRTGRVATGHRPRSVPRGTFSPAVRSATTRIPSTLWRLCREARRSPDTAFCCSSPPRPQSRRRGRAGRGTRRAGRRRCSVRTPYVLWYTTSLYRLTGVGIYRTIPWAGRGISI